MAVVHPAPRATAVDLHLWFWQERLIRTFGFGCVILYWFWLRDLSFGTWDPSPAPNLLLCTRWHVVLDVVNRKSSRLNRAAVLLCTLGATAAAAVVEEPRNFSWWVRRVRINVMHLIINNTGKVDEMTECLLKASSASFSDTFDAWCSNHRTVLLRRYAQIRFFVENYPSVYCFRWDANHQFVVVFFFRYNRKNMNTFFFCFCYDSNHQYIEKSRIVTVDWADINTPSRSHQTLALKLRRCCRVGNKGKGSQAKKKHSRPLFSILSNRPVILWI